MTYLNKLFKEVENDPEFIIQKSLIDFFEQVNEILLRRKISRLELSRFMNVSESYLSEIFKGEANLRNISQIVGFLNSELKISIKEKDY